MKGKKFEWFTYEDTMETALMLNARMMDFLSKTNVKFFFMDSRIEICNLGFREGELKTILHLIRMDMYILMIKTNQYLKRS
jgi:hypothetical protein